MAHRGRQPLFYYQDDQSVNSYHDYKLWRALGVASDALLAVLVLTTLALVLAVL